MSDYAVIRLAEMAISTGEEKTESILSGFSSPENPEIEKFVRFRAMDFSRKKMSMTHLVMNMDRQLAGFFTLTHKPIIIQQEKMSKTFCRRLERHAKYDASIHAYYLSAFLIAQFGKNYALDREHGISGNRLMELALSTLKSVQKDIGGEAVFLECEDREKLLDFYQSENNRFLRFGERISDSEEDARIRYIQLIRFL